MSAAAEQIVKPYHQTDRFSLYEGDCRSVLPIFADCSFDSIVTDPPYELGFMSKSWDRSGIAYDVSVWSECLRVLKPGGHLLAFGGSRTYHRLACAIEDAGFEIRDQIQWLYGSGFPKSLNVSKQIDLMERDLWLGIKQLIEELDHGVIIEAWKATLSTVELVDSPSLKSRVAVGLNTQRSDSVPVNAPLLISPKRLLFNAIIAELQFCEAPLSSGVDTTFARVAVDTNTEPSQVPAVSVEQLLQNPSLKVFITASIAHSGVRVSLNGSTAHSLRDEEALRIWLGKKKCLDRRDTDALCAGLIDGLKLTILSQSKTFQNLDTQSQTECASAMTVTTTASTAASLISFTVDTLRNVAIDAAAGAEREVVGEYLMPVDSTAPNRRPSQGLGYGSDLETSRGRPVTAPSTEAAQQWNGWGTALKPAHEPLVLARKPMVGTVAQNILEHGTGGLNIDGCRIEGVPPSVPQPIFDSPTGNIYGFKTGEGRNGKMSQSQLGRWPSNVCHDGSEEVLAGFPDTQSGWKDTDEAKRSIWNSERAFTGLHFSDNGSAARFFYAAKASQEDRNEGLNGSRNGHPTVKPISLARYLCRLITPPGGTVLDPFCGSGSTGKAAMLEGFKFIGIELNADYCQLAQLRIEAVTRQGLLFA